VLVEVLSRSTANVDRGEKLDAYREIPALRKYMLVDIPRRAVHVYRRADRDQWSIHTYRSGLAIELASLAFELDAQAVFADLLPQSSNANPT
jgi:Uma2 family endonuclease